MEPMTPYRTPPSTPPVQWNNGSLQSLSQGSSPPPPQLQLPSNPPPRPVLPNYAAEIERIRQECDATVAEVTQHLAKAMEGENLARRELEKAKQEAADQKRAKEEAEFAAEEAREAQEEAERAAREMQEELEERKKEAEEAAKQLEQIHHENLHKLVRVKDKLQLQNI